MPPIRRPTQHFPAMAAAQHRRLPTTGQLQDWSHHAGLTAICVTHAACPMHIDADVVEGHVRDEIPHRYPEITADELSAGLQQLRADQQQPGGPWHELRTHDRDRQTGTTLISQAERADADQAAASAAHNRARNEIRRARKARRHADARIRRLTKQIHELPN